MSEHILLRHREIPDLNQLEVYQANGGFEAFRKAVTSMQPADVINEVQAILACAGAAARVFPPASNGASLPNNIWPHYVVANADESEPGTFKDREIMESNPFQFLEGLMITAYAVQANAAYIYLRGEFWQIARQLDQRIAELEQAGLLGEHVLGTDYALHLLHPPGRGGLHLR